MTDSISDPMLLDFWHWFESLGPSQATITAPLLNKYRSLLLREPVRNVLAQPEQSWSVAEVMTKRAITGFQRFPDVLVKPGRQ